MQSLLRPHLSVHSVAYTWAASYNMLVHKALRSVIEKKPASEKIFPVVFCIAVRMKGHTSSQFRFYISAEICWRKHIVLPATLDSKTRIITWDRLSGFLPLVQVIKDEFDTVRAGNSVVVMTTPIKSLGCQEGSAVSSASIGSVVQLVKLYPPTKQLESKCSETARANAKKTESETAQTVMDPNLEARAAQAQTSGLNLLVEEAEADIATTAHQSPDEMDHATGDDRDLFHFFASRGIASACGHNEEYDTVMENEFRKQFETEGFGVASSIEEQHALSSIEKKELQIDNQEHQDIICHLQTHANLDMDSVEAAVEATVASSQGLDAVPDLSGADRADDGDDLGESFHNSIQVYFFHFEFCMYVVRMRLWL